MKIKLEDLQVGTILIWQGTCLRSSQVKRIVNESWCQGVYLGSPNWDKDEYWRERSILESFDYITVVHPDEPGPNVSFDPL